MNLINPSDDDAIERLGLAISERKTDNSKYAIGTKLQWKDSDIIGLIVPNYKFAGDICVTWSSGIESSYDSEFLDEHTIIVTQ